SALCRHGAREGVRNRRLCADCRSRMVSCRGSNVFRGDVPAVQGRRLVKGEVLRSRRTAHVAHLYGATALACLFSCAFPMLPASAQDLRALAESRVDTSSQMLLEADTLVYDNDKQTVTAV